MSIMEHAELEIVRDFEPLMLPLSSTVAEAARHMQARNTSAVLVTEGDATLAGIFTQRDAISRVLANGKNPIVTTLGEVMTNNPVGVTSQATATEITRAMRKVCCRHLSIVQDGRVVGIVSLVVPGEA
jgi:signal-transduction protein with cAMP-binding, CBS, and nucleotidyltransferase domain